MKPASFEIIRAGSLTEATRLLAESKGAARLIAGSQSLGPMLNLRLAQPRLLIDITGIQSLTRIEDAVDSVTIGACVSTANIEDRCLPGRGLDMLPSVAAHIAYRAVRNRGTIGGSLCHADPAADLVSTLCALEAECLIVGTSGNRKMFVDQFITGAYKTALADDELLDAIRVPRVSTNGTSGFYKVCRKAGEFATAIGAVVSDPERGILRFVIGATRGRPIVVANAHELRLPDSSIDESAIQRLFDRHGIVDRVARHQKATALIRAYHQAMLKS